MKFYSIFFILLLSCQILLFYYYHCSHFNKKEKHRITNVQMYETRYIRFKESFDSSNRKRLSRFTWNIAGLQWKLYFIMDTKRGRHSVRFAGR